jgi:hypothetical protein
MIAPLGLLGNDGRAPRYGCTIELAIGVMKAVTGKRRTGQRRCYSHVLKERIPCGSGVNLKIWTRLSPSLNTTIAGQSYVGGSLIERK